MFDLLIKRYPRTFSVPFNHVDLDPADAGDGGGDAGGSGGTPAGDPDESTLDEGGKTLLRNARTAERTALRRAEAAELQIKALSKNVSPEDLRAAQEAARQAQAEVEAAGQQIEAERKRLGTKHARELQVANDARLAAETKATTKTIEFLTKESFYAAGGDSSIDEEGNSCFQVFMSTKGHKHLRLRPDEETVYVVDAAGDELLDDKGKPMLLKDWISKQADGSAVLGRLFKPRQGEGSGVRSTNGIRSVRGPDIQKMSQNQLLEAGWPG